MSSVARFCANPSRDYWPTLIEWFSTTGTLYRVDALNEMAGYSDANWAGEVGDRKSASGYVFLLGGAAVSWKSTKQTTVALSTAEAEYVALSTTLQETIWLQQLLSVCLGKWSKQ